MKILAFTDIHCDKKATKRLKKKAEQVDICICAGDFSRMGSGTEQMLELFNEFGKEILLIPGNHEDENEVKRKCKQLENITFLHKRYEERKNIVFVGFGGGGFSDKDERFEAFVRKTTFPKKPMVLITHQPPYKTTLDKLDEHVGSKSYRKFIETKSISLHICGHLHENEGKEDNIGKTKIMNPGKTGIIITI